MHYARVFGTLVVSLSLLSACGKKEDTPLVRRAKPKPLAAKVEAPPPIFDAHGNLLPSERRVEWLEVPRGYVESRQIGTSYVFVSHEVPLDRLEAFYGARALPHVTQRVGGGVHFLAAAPVDGGDLPRLRIEMEQGRSARDTLLRIAVQPAASPSEQLSLSEAKSALIQDEKRAE